MSNENEDRPNRLTIGGMTLERPNGAISHLSPLAQYKFTEEQLELFYEFLEKNEAVQKATMNLHMVLQTELRSFAKHRVEEKKKNNKR